MHIKSFASHPFWAIFIHRPYMHVSFVLTANIFQEITNHIARSNFYYIPRRKSGIYWIQVRRAAAAAAVEISLWTR